MVGINKFSDKERRKARRSFQFDRYKEDLRYARNIGNAPMKDKRNSSVQRRASGAISKSNTRMRMPTNNGPKVWDRILNTVPFEAVIMGGAVIDYLYGWKVNDIDVFHTYKVGEPFAITPPGWQMLEKFNEPDWVEAHQQQYLQGINEFGQHPVGSVYDFLVDGHIKVQLIGVHYNDPKTHFHNFDHSLTLGRYTKNGMFVHRKVFETVANHVVEYTCPYKNEEHMVRALERAKAKVKKVTGGVGGGGWTYRGFDKPNPEHKIGWNF